MDCASLSRQVCCQYCSCRGADEQRCGVDEGGAVCPTHTLGMLQVPHHLWPPLLCLQHCCFLVRALVPCHQKAASALLASCFFSLLLICPPLPNHCIFAISALESNSVRFISVQNPIYDLILRGSSTQEQQYNCMLCFTSLHSRYTEVLHAVICA